MFEETSFTVANVVKKFVLGTRTQQNSSYIKTNANATRKNTEIIVPKEIAYSYKIDKVHPHIRARTQRVKDLQEENEEEEGN